MVRDLEELVLLVRDEAAREQIREAVRCYHAGANRAAVVMSVAAGMYDLRRRVDDLVASGAGGLCKLRNSISAKEKAGEAWEKLLLDGCKRDDLISSSEHQKLDLLLRERHLCAHPTGHVGSAEDARAAISSLVDIVLSRPTQAGGKEAIALVEDRLPLAHYFGNDPRQVVWNELSILSTSKPNLAKNAIVFLAEMTKLRRSDLSAAAFSAIKAIEKMLMTGQANSLLPVFSHAPDSVDQLSPIARGRVVDMLCRNTGADFAVIDTLLAAKVFFEGEQGSLVSSVVQAACPSGHSCTEVARTVLANMQAPDVRSRVGEWLVELGLRSETRRIQQQASLQRRTARARGLGSNECPGGLRVASDRRLRCRWASYHCQTVPGARQHRLLHVSPA